MKPLQTLGLFGARHFDKYAFSVPIPSYDGDNDDHSALVALARTAEHGAAAVDLSSTKNFKAARGRVRQGIEGTLSQIDQLVLKLISPLETTAS